MRESDGRARVLCKHRRSRSTDYFCLPLNLLVIIRLGNCLQLCRKRRSGTELVLWANLKFRTLEGVYYPFLFLLLLSILRLILFPFSRHLERVMLKYKQRW